MIIRSYHTTLVSLKVLMIETVKKYVILEH